MIKKLNLRLTERYRPKYWDDLIGNPRVIASIRSAVVFGISNGFPILLFIGPPGVGKTSTANVIAKLPIFNDFSSPIEYNASDDRGLDFIRTTLKKQLMCLGHNLVILDEADNLTKDAQEALRRIMEKMSPQTLLILIGNEDTFTDALKSRCLEYSFNRISKDEIIPKLQAIINEEKFYATVNDIQFLDIIARQANGDIRKAINTLSMVVTADKTITESSIQILQINQDTDYNLQSLKKEDDSMRQMQNDFLRRAGDGK